MPGRRVQVPLGARSATGVVLGDAPEKPAGAAATSSEQDRTRRGLRGGAAGRPLRDVLRLLDDGPLLTAEVIELCRFAADHYLHPFGLALKAALPPGTEIREAVVARLTAAGEEGLRGPDQLDLGGGGGPDPRRAGAAETRRLLRAVAGGERVQPAQLRALARQGLVSLRREERAARVGTPTVELVQALPGAAERLGETARAPRQRALLEYLLARAGTVPAEELLAAFPGSRPLLRRLLARGLAALELAPAGPAAAPEGPWGGSEGGAQAPPTAAQARALSALSSALDGGAFAPFLLHGVTGSGKTRVYLEAIAQARGRGRTALALVPEIALTPQLAGRFRARFGDDVAVLHSGLTDRERLAEWLRVSAGGAGVVVGARSAVFAPLRNLGIVVVDEEHEPSYKQEERLRYHARDLALVRARLSNAVCVLGSATPSLETLRRLQLGKLPELALPERIETRPMPQVSVVDRKAGRAPRGEPPRLISGELSRALAETLARGEQSILFLNRRGHARTLLCWRCGNAVGCPNCSVALVLHREGGEELRCHLCGHREPPRPRCAACGSEELRPLSAGTERVEEEVRVLLPRARVARLDRDAASGPGQAASILAHFARRELDVLAGTQMVAKGHDFPGVTLVGVLDADGPLQLPDFRAGERCAQLLAQVSGRAGRGETPGRVLLQALRPGEPAVQSALSHDYTGFARGELLRREALGFPPFARLLAVRLQGNAPQRVEQAAGALGELARSFAARGEPVDVLGPSPAPLARLRGKHRFQLLLRAPEHGPLHRVGRALETAHARSAPAGVELALDVDPVALL